MGVSAAGVPECVRGGQTFGCAGRASASWGVGVACMCASLHVWGRQVVCARGRTGVWGQKGKTCAELGYPADPFPTTVIGFSYAFQLVRAEKKAGGKKSPAAKCSGQ